VSVAKFLLNDKVRKEWVDYNGHMNDAEYSRVFSWSVDRFMDFIGLDDSSRTEKQYTMFTLETHICYLAEMNLDEELEIRCYLLDYDYKRVHLFFELYGADNKRAATSEQLLMGIDQQTGKSATFPEAVSANVQAAAENYTPDEQPKEAGSTIGIRHKR